jgi:hypothetical protein
MDQRRSAVGSVVARGDPDVPLPVLADRQRVGQLAGEGSAPADAEGEKPPVAGRRLDELAGVQGPEQPAARGDRCGGGAVGPAGVRAE